MITKKPQNLQLSKDQYRDASNLNVRLQIHARFSVNPYGWTRWVFDQFTIPSSAHILELGCGSGALWRDNRDRIPENWELVLSDFSEGMVREAEKNLRNQNHLKLELIDAEASPLPFSDACFEAVIANHLLYHIADRQALLSEIARILKPGGLFYSSTIGQRHCSEVNDLLKEFNSNLRGWDDVQQCFNLENGAAQFPTALAYITISRYPDSLRVTDPEMLADYILSGQVVLTETQKTGFREFIRQKMLSQRGVIEITKDSGIFKAVRI
jgi:SAM-dependent methyltransferase